MNEEKVVGYRYYAGGRLVYSIAYKLFPPLKTTDKIILIKYTLRMTVSKQNDTRN